MLNNFSCPESDTYVSGITPAASLKLLSPVSVSNSTSNMNGSLNLRMYELGLEKIQEGGDLILSQ